MSHSLHPDYQLAEIRERHAHLRRQAEYSRLTRESKSRHRYRSRHRRRKT